MIEQSFVVFRHDRATTKRFVRGFVLVKDAHLETPNAELSGPRPLAAEGSRSNDGLGAERPGKETT